MSDDDKYPAMLAGMTAVISELCELLIEKHIVNRSELHSRFRGLLERVPETNYAADVSAPIKHLIGIIEANEDGTRHMN